MVKFGFKFVLLFACLIWFGLSGCDTYKPLDPRSDKDKEDDKWQDWSKRETIFGPGGLSLFGSDGNLNPEGGALGVNSFLWRASLDTIVFMPVSSADPFGGVIITDWHTPSEAPEERFKLNIYILGKSLRADGIRVAAFRQVMSSDGKWRDAKMPKATSIKIEDAILTRARQLRNKNIGQNKN